MLKKILTTRPKHDVATLYLYDFSKDIVTKIKTTKGLHITNLEGKKANRKNFEKSMAKEKPRLVFLNGHGNKNCVSGHKNEVILDATNIDLAKDKIVYALACDSLDNLGKIATQKGVSAYIGYKESFMVVRDPTRTSNPKKDKNALPFRKACSTIINSLVLDGKTVIEAIELTKAEYIQLIRSYGTSADDTFGDTPLIRFALAWDLQFLGMEGDPSARF